jgi:hypothetical protein
LKQILPKVQFDTLPNGELNFNALSARGDISSYIDKKEAEEVFKKLYAKISS